MAGEQVLVVEDNRTSMKLFRDVLLATGYRPLEAEALRLRSILERKFGDYAAAEKTLYEALRAAESGQHDREKAKVWTALVDVVGTQLGRPDAALEHAKNAAAVLERVHDPDLEGSLANSVGIVLDKKGDHEAALARFQIAVEIFTRAHGAEHPHTLSALDNVGHQQLALARYADAATTYQRVLALRERALGSEHPLVAASTDNVGDALRAQQANTSQ